MSEQTEVEKRLLDEIDRMLAGIEDPIMPVSRRMYTLDVNKIENLDDVRCVFAAMDLAFPETYPFLAPIKHLCALKTVSAE